MKLIKTEFKSMHKKYTGYMVIVEENAGFYIDDFGNWVKSFNMDKPTAKQLLEARAIIKVSDNSQTRLF